MYEGNGVVTISKLNFDTKCMLVANFTPWPIYSKAKRPHRKLHEPSNGSGGENQEFEDSVVTRNIVV
jgi:hypothetical protein